MMNNKEIRMAIFKKGLKHYQVARALKISACTFSRWLQFELDEEKKKYVLGVIEEL